METKYVPISEDIANDRVRLVAEAVKNVCHYGHIDLEDAR